MRPLLLVLTTSALLGLPIPAAAHSGAPGQASAGSARTSPAIEPKSGWERPSCSRLPAALEASLWGAFGGLLFVSIPAGVLAFTRYRSYGLALALGGTFGGAGLVGTLYLAVIPERQCSSKSPADIDAHVDSDSLYRLWSRFSVERDPKHQRVLAMAIYCERLRLSSLEPWGGAAVALAQSRVATRHDFEVLDEYRRGLIGTPDAGIACDLALDGYLARALGAETGRPRVSGRALDAETGRPVVGMIALPNSLPSMNPSDGSFTFDKVRTSGDSATLYVCANGYELTKQRVWIRDPGGRPIDVAVKKLRLPPGTFESAESWTAKIDSCKSVISGVGR